MGIKTDLELPILIRKDKALPKYTEPVCPKCGSNNLFKFEKDIYIVNGKDFTKKPLYGCKNCNTGFVDLSEADRAITRQDPQKVTVQNVQSVLGNLSKSCFNVLGNVK